VVALPFEDMDLTETHGISLILSHSPKKDSLQYMLVGGLESFFSIYWE
jgi:hypothetical protein